MGTLERHIVVVGMMGAGKSTLGRMLAKHLEVPYVDHDEILEATTGMSGREIASQLGVDRLHALESEVFLECLDRSTPSTISAATSIIDSRACRIALAAPIVCWLRLPVDAILERIAHDGGKHRRTGSDIAARFEQRERRFAEVADIETNALHAPEAILQAVVNGLGSLRESVDDTAL